MLIQVPKDWKLQSVEIYLYFTGEEAHAWLSVLQLEGYAQPPPV